MSKSNSNQISSDSVEIKISSPVSVNSDDILVRVEYFYKSGNNKSDDDNVSKLSSTNDGQKNYAIYEELTDHTTNTSSTGLDTMAGFTSGGISSGGNSDAAINTKVVSKQSYVDEDATTTKNEATNVELNQDDNPEVITKQSNQIIEYKQGEFLNKMFLFHRYYLRFLKIFLDGSSWY